MLKQKKSYAKIMAFWLFLGMKNRRVAAIDFILLIAAVYLGYALRLTLFIEERYVAEMLLAGLVFSLFILVSLYTGGLYKVMWPQASVEEYARLLMFYCIGSGIFLAAQYILRPAEIPRSSLAIFLLSGIFFLSGVRALWRLAQIQNLETSGRRKNALIVGAGDAGVLLARDLLRHNSPITPIGFIDDNPAKRGMTIASLTILGNRKDLPRIIMEKGVDTVLLAMPSASGEQIRAYFDILSPFNVTVRVLPSLAHLADGQITISKLRSVNLEDLLRREQVRLDNQGIESAIKAKTVMVTGAGGSIGFELCRQILERKPKKLLALGHGEQSIYLLLESLADTGNMIPVLPIIADTADRTAVERSFAKYSPELVFHAAAHKHVPLMEYNPLEALRVNAFGTWNLAASAGRHGVERFVMISTDKAVHPTSVMGATKRIAERLLQKVQLDYPKTKYMSVRLGNVLGSRGSVVPKFERQIEAGGPVTVTHPEMKRYFMLIPEAVSLILQAGVMGSGGELYVLDMGEPVNISDMAETLIRLHGYEPHKDIEIKYTGIRPGEKLYEELFYDPIHVDITGHSKIFKTKLTPDTEDVLSKVNAVLSRSEKGTITDEEIRAEVFSLGNEG